MTGDLNYPDSLLHAFTAIDTITADNQTQTIPLNQLKPAAPGAAEPMIEQGLARIRQRIDWQLLIIGTLIFTPVPWLLGLRLKILTAVHNIHLAWTYAAAITYFSVVALVPLLMIAFAVTGVDTPPSSSVTDTEIS